MAAVLAVCCVAPSAAQESRAALLAEEQAAKATRLRPYEPSRAERVMIRAERALGGQPTGLYPWLGSIFSGGLLSFGPGVRLPYAGGGALDAQVALSLKGYRLARATLTLPPLANRRVRISARAETIDAGSVAFYGLGNDTLPEAKSTYRFRPTAVGVSASVTPVPFLELGGGLDYLSVATARGTRGTSAEDRFTDDAVPGLRASPTYVLTRAHAAVDWRDSPGYSRRGGYYRIGWADYNERSDGLFSFRRVDADLRQMIPVLRENWVIALRATVSTTSTAPGHQAPFFLLPQLGGGSDLRGYPSWRFRDKHRVLFNAEYRWTPAHLIDMALFHDAGKVTAERGELNFRGLTHTSGIGIRVHAPAATFLRFEVARGREGIGLVMAFGQSF